MIFKFVRRASAEWWLCLPIALLSACGAGDSALVREAREAEADGRVLDNDIMYQTYPKSYRAGSPKYLERDYEAGVNFMCDEIRDKYKRDICAEPEINWRR